MAAFVSRYARAFADVVASARLDTAAIDRQLSDFLATWVDYNRGIGQMREWFVKGLSLSGVKAEDVPVELNI